MTVATFSPDDLRISVYGARWYHDPLPACDIAPATADRWPSVTTVKGAWAKPYRKKLATGELVKFDTYHAAHYAIDNVHELLTTEHDKAVALVATAGGRTLSGFADRGTTVHAVLEDLAEPDVIVDERLVPDEARPYVDACRAFVADCRPKWLLSEFVVFNRGIGFAGTGDAILEIAGVRYLVDWKSRSGQHGAYEEEAAQIGGYAMAEYAIGAEGRFRLPPIEAGLIVSITADEGYQLYPIDLVKGAEAFVQMHECWKRHREGTMTARRAIDKPVDLTIVDHMTEQRIEWLKNRMRFIREGYPAAFEALAATWPADVPTFKEGGHTPGQLEQIARTITKIEDAHALPF